MLSKNDQKPGVYMSRNLAILSAVMGENTCNVKF